MGLFPPLFTLLWLPTAAAAATYILLNFRGEKFSRETLSGGDGEHGSNVTAIRAIVPLTADQDGPGAVLNFISSRLYT